MQTYITVADFDYMQDKNGNSMAGVLHDMRRRKEFSEVRRSHPPIHVLPQNQGSELLIIYENCLC